MNPHKVGNSAYDPKTMLKLVVYGYSYGIKGSRKLERAAHENLGFIWLMGGLKPDHKTIAEFRRNNKETLKLVLRQCARMCIKLGLIEGEHSVCRRDKDTCECIEREKSQQSILSEQGRGYR